MPRSEVIIVGAGVIGLSTAYYLTRYNTQPLVLDAATTGHGATALAAGVFSHQLWNRLDMQLVQFSIRELLHLPSRQRRPLGINRSGLVTIARTRRHVSVLEQVHRALGTIGVPAELLDAADGAARFPALRWTDVSRALFSPADLCLDPVGFVRLLRALVESRDGHVRENWPVTRVAADRSGPQVHGLKGLLRSEQVVVACGAASATVLGDGRPALPVRSYVAQLARFESRTTLRLPAFHDLIENCYARPLPRHAMLAGDGTEMIPTATGLRSHSPSPQFLQHIRKAMTWRLPRHTLRLTRAWSGVCDATPDRHPLIGPVPGMRGCFVACGLQGFGIMRALAIGEYLAALLTGRSPQNRLERYAPARFARPMKFRPREGFTLDLFEGA